MEANSRQHKHMISIMEENSINLLDGFDQQIKFTFFSVKPE